MRPFVVIALIACVPWAAQAQTKARTFVCEGAGKSFVHPFEQDVAKKFRVVDDGERSTVFELGAAEANICAGAAVCSVSSSAGTVEIVVKEILNGDPYYSSRFRFHRGKRGFEASGGGLDVSWSISGRCKAQPLARR